MTQAEILDKIANAAKCEGYAAACGDVLDLLSKIPVDVTLFVATNMRAKLAEYQKKNPS